jgi:hypothetical protein
MYKFFENAGLIGKLGNGKMEDETHGFKVRDEGSQKFYK